ncbi:hypothetical protein ACRAKI_33975 [Saccharothrix isguenensis]
MRSCRLGISLSVGDDRYFRGNTGYADVHVLFDRGLVAVDPATAQVCVAPVLQVQESYAPLGGRTTTLAGVDLAAVREHFDVAATTWGRRR